MVTYICSDFIPCLADLCAIGIISMINLFSYEDICISYPIHLIPAYRLPPSVCCLLPKIFHPLFRLPPQNYNHWVYCQSLINCQLVHCSGLNSCIANFTVSPKYKDASPKVSDITFLKARSTISTVTGSALS